MNELGAQLKGFAQGLPFYKISLGAVFLNLLILAATFVVSSQALPPRIPLFYGRPYGIEQIASSRYFSLPSLIALIVSFVNIGIASVINDDFTKKVLIGAIVIISALSLITTAKIALLVGYF